MIRCGSGWQEAYGSPLAENSVTVSGANTHTDTHTHIYLNADRHRKTHRLYSGRQRGHKKLDKHRQRFTHRRRCEPSFKHSHLQGQKAEKCTQVHARQTETFPVLLWQTNMLFLFRTPINAHLAEKGGKGNEPKLSAFRKTVQIVVFFYSLLTF